MNRILLVALMICLIVGLSASAYAGGAPAFTPKHAFTPRQGTKAGDAESTISPEILAYRHNIGNKAERGVKTILSSWTEIPDSVSALQKETNDPFQSIFVGTLRGVLKTLGKIATGVSDVVTAPISPEKGPVFQEPELNLE